MKKYRAIVSLIVLVLLMSVLSGCDNRTQAQKDVDAAAKEVKDALK